MNVLVTGGHGFIGSHLVKFLQDKYPDYHIYYPRSNDVNFKYVSHAKWCIDAREPDVIFHLAANPNTKPNPQQPNKTFEENVLMTKNIAQFATKGATVIFASSVLISGPNISGSNPQTEYALSKQVSENVLRFYAKTNDLNVGVARLCATVGPNMTHGMLYHWLQKLKSNEDTIEVFGKRPGFSKPFTHVDTVVTMLDNLYQQVHSERKMRTICVTPNIAPYHCNVAELIKLTQKIAGTDKKVIWNEDAVWAGDHNIDVISDIGRYGLEIDSASEFAKAVKENL